MFALRMPPLPRISLPSLAARNASRAVPQAAAAMRLQLPSARSLLLLPTVLTAAMSTATNTTSPYPPVNPAELLHKDVYKLQPDVTVTDYTFRVPLNYSQPDGHKINIFARGIRRTKLAEDAPYFIYLQGGPGFEVASAQTNPITTFMADHDFQMLYLDQRGTGLSSALTAESLATVSSDPHRLADFVSNFRAPQIVQDAEAIRQALLGADAKWGVVGQSFGGFCALTYLSFYPAGLREVWTFGGMAPVTARHPEDVYARLYPMVERRNAAFYEKYPGDRDRIARIVRWLAAHPPALPSGGTLTVNRFRELGIVFGQHGGIDNVHQLIARMTADLDAWNTLTAGTLAALESLHSFTPNPLYALLHESIYATPHSGATGFAANATLPARFTAADPFLFTGEQVFPEAYATHGGLAPLRPVAEVLARKDDWGALYDVERLARNTVPVYAAVYQQDMYVDVGFARETVALTGAKSWESSVLFHNAVRAKSSVVLEALWNLREEIAD